jgi:BirA family transcriptional regulator, biotin operon repressor / biotin---[acetyl-CoA-carboxylase] ligase
VSTGAVRSATYDGEDLTVLTAAVPCAAVHAYETIDSTQDAAHALAQGGAVHGTAVVADTQRAGRGRSGGAWVSEPGHGVWVSVILREVGEMPNGLLALRTGFALAPILDKWAASRVQLKWPNDLYVDGRKLAGVLTEARWNGARAEWIVVGIGINVRAPAGVDTATGLQDGARRRDVCIAALRAALAAARATGPLHAMELGAFTARDMLRGRQIVAPAVGTVLGVRADGALRVETAHGEEAVVSGSVEFDPQGG